ncbi:MAG: N-acetylmuramoyl-L-alanine amidase [Ignavibacteriales bacterium]|nr:N-acetylmuramoyl-L-alanine amidase [Ignavibacteriales bacterium]
MLKKIILSIFVFITIAGAQNSVQIEYIQKKSRNTQIGSFIKNDITYGSLNDLGYVLNLRLYTNQNSKKLELRNSEITIRVTAGNSFVVIVDNKENANLHQLPVNIIFAAGSFFAPLEYFIPLLKIAISEEIAFQKNKIIIGEQVQKSNFDITGIQFEEKSNGLLIKIENKIKPTDYECWPKQIGNDTWLYITIANAKADVNKIKNAVTSGIVKQILAFQYPTSVQITIRLKGQINSAEPMVAENGTDILIAIQTLSTEQADARSARNYERELQREREKWKLDVVVIDAGHGGDDPGAISRSGTREKDITLPIALKLGALIEKNLPGVDVVYTRKTDTFVELYRRGQIANQTGGKLFISIHCNSMPRKKSTETGFEIYLLRPGKTENALRIAEKENEVVKLEQGYEKRYQQLTEENFILLTMAQSAYVKYSEQFAEILTQEMGKHLDLPNNGVKQAGFYVLVGASMPNVLVETGYLSNRHDEKILKSAKGQQRLAEAIFNGVKRFKDDYEKALSEGRASQ